MSYASYVGFDVGKASHSFAVVTEAGAICESGEVSTRSREMRSLVRRLSRTYPGAIAVCESTGIYHEQLGTTCLAEGLALQIVNPLLTTTKALRRNVRSVKTDRSDAERLAQRLREVEGAFGYPFTWNDDWRRLHALGRSLNLLVRHQVALQRHVDTMLERPLDAPVLPNRMLIDGEVNRLRSELARLARVSFPIEMEILTSIKGVGDYSAAVVLAEAGDVRRFPTSAALVAFAGIDPRIKRSGTSVNGLTHMTKAGSPLLRRTVGWLAHTLVQWNPAFDQVFARAVERGKPLGVAYGIISRKFLTVAYQCLKRRVPFDPSLVGSGHVLADDAREICSPGTPNGLGWELESEGEHLADYVLGN